jgi:hypothetical protein
MIGTGFARFTFLEESPEGVGTIARAAVTMGIGDARALSAAITNVLAEAEAKAAADANDV